MSEKLISICLNEIRRLRRQITLALSRGRTTTPVNDSGLVRVVQGNLGINQIVDDIPLVQQYGFASNPPVGTDFFMGCLAGDRSNGAITATNNQTYILKNLGNGSVALYDMFGNKVVLSSVGFSLTDFSGNSVVSSSAGIKVHGASCYEWDVNGYGQKITWTGGTSWTIDNYTTGATVTTNTHAINPPGPP
jgi:phage gp45-like